MILFKHRHYWTELTGVNRVRDPGKSLPHAAFILEECRCGAIRQIEYRLGESPKVYIVENRKNADG